MTDPVRGLTIGQRFQLGILCEEFDSAVAIAHPRPPANDRERAGVVANTAHIARYLKEQRIRWEQFSDEDKEDYRPAFFAAVMLHQPRDYEESTLGYDTPLAASASR